MIDKIVSEYAKFIDELIFNTIGHGFKYLVAEYNNDNISEGKITTIYKGYKDKAEAETAIEQSKHECNLMDLSNAEKFLGYTPDGHF